MYGNISKQQYKSSRKFDWMRKRSGPPKYTRRRALLSFVLGLGLAIILVAASLWLVPRGAAPLSVLVPGHSAGSNLTPIPGRSTMPSLTQIVGHSAEPTPGQVTTGKQTPGENTTGVSPLLFGTNLGLFDANDMILTSTAAQGLLQQLHARMIRMPVRDTLSEATQVQAAQIIKNLGAIPLVVLEGQDVIPNALATDRLIIQDMNRIFGNSIVYYEYGNEEDLLGISMDKYTASWNSLIPQLKPLALNGHFIGPVNYQYDKKYLQYFLQRAQPVPDEISWHEYTCDDKWAASLCISNIDKWTNHFADARAVMNATIGKTLPIMITEWNYAPNAVPNDGKNNDSAFMTTWTTKAFQTLAANRIFASMQYSCTNTAIPMITGNGSITAQGTTFQTQYQNMIAG